MNNEMDSCLQEINSHIQEVNTCIQEINSCINAQMTVEAPKKSVDGKPVGNIVLGLVLIAVVATAIITGLAVWHSKNKDSIPAKKSTHRHQSPSLSPNDRELLSLISDMAEIIRKT